MSDVVFNTFTVSVPDGWSDITSDVDGDNPPSTLASFNGVGALQFSVALYQSGPDPDPSQADLQQMVKDFGTERGLGAPVSLAAETFPVRLAAGSFHAGCEYIRVWHVSDGQNFAFITYVCDWSEQRMELPDCERIVRSLRFGRRDGTS